jgi:hypothetical protein
LLLCSGGIGADRAALDRADRNGVDEPVDPGDLSGLVFLRRRRSAREHQGRGSGDYEFR